MEKQNKIKYEAIFVLVNQGFADPVMDVARKHGVKGGTIINARGGSNSEAEKNYGIVITPDKELLLILIDIRIKEEVINAIYNTAGIETNGMGIIWTMPADNLSFVSKREKLAKEDKKEDKKDIKKK